MARREWHMTVQTRVEGDIVVVEAAGDITLGKGSDLVLKEAIVALLGQGRRKLVLDVGQVGYVDSAGLGQLVQLHTTAARHDGTLKLLRVTPRLRTLLKATRLLGVFETFDGEAEALASFKKGSGVI
jgi:anti-sigma B factor antagonist